MRRRLLESILVIGLGMLLIGNAMMKNKEKFHLEAHRGWSQMYPENTLIAFEEAGKCKAYDAIETDVQETADGVLVLMHDRKLDRTTDASGKMKDYTFEQVRNFKIDGGNQVEKYPDEKIPTLEEFLEICKKYKKTPYIEMKTMTDAGIERLIRTLEEGGWNGKCVLTTFRYENLERVRKITSEYPIQYMVSEEFSMEDVLPQLQAYENIAFRPSAYAVTEDIMEVCKANNIGVECYGLNPGDIEKYEELKRLGVMGVTCNDWRGLE